MVFSLGVLSILHVGVLTAGLIVLLINPDIHAQNIPLKPVQLLHLLLDERRRSVMSMCGAQLLGEDPVIHFVVRSSSFLIPS
jgi:hypothetical protein